MNAVEDDSIIIGGVGQGGKSDLLVPLVCLIVQQINHC